LSIIDQVVSEFAGARLELELSVEEKMDLDGASLIFISPRKECNSIRAILIDAAKQGLQTNTSV
jgi:hypothetical protein